MSWQPSSSIEHLKIRAKTLTQIRNFFATRHILEVETPLLCQHTVTDVHIDNFALQYHNGSQPQLYYLQTSPEYAMKRLLAAGSGAIFQITKSFRQDQSGRQHNPEFSMIEWYRPGFNHHHLMDEVDAFLQEILETHRAARYTYRELFAKFLDLDPMNVSLEILKKIILEKAHPLDSQLLQTLDHDTCLQLLMSDCIEPQLGMDAPAFVHDFPASQAALAKIRHDTFPVAERFEVYIQGMEIANGFHELTDAHEQQKRFERDQAERKKQQKTAPQIDHYFLSALQHGLPQCSGVALGLDRLMMLKMKTNHISEVISFSWERA